jgi:hypothetical protein
MDLKPSNGVATKNDAAKEMINANPRNGSVKMQPASTQTQPEKSKIELANLEKPKNEGAKSEQTKPDQPTLENEQPQPIMTLDAKLKVLNDLHRRSIQRLNLISRITQLETFEVALAQEGDELEENIYQGCKLIIRDDKNREFLTTTPGLIRMVAQFIFEACNTKLKEIESSINFPNA